MYVEGEDQFSICGPSGIELQIAFLKLTGEFHVLLLNESDLALKLIDIGLRSESGFAPCLLAEQLRQLAFQLSVVRGQARDALLSVDQIYLE